MIKMYQIIKVANHYGAPKLGSHEGPEKIISALQEMDSILTRDVIEIDMLDDLPPLTNGVYARAKNLPQVKMVCENLSQAVRKVLECGNIPVVLQGEDSAVIGVGYGISPIVDEPFGVVYFDSHGDLNTPETTPSGCFYGMGLAHLLGYGHPELLTLNDGMPVLKPEDIVLIGTRDLDPGEIDLIREKRIITYSPQDVGDRLGEILSEIELKFRKRGIKKIYYHADQDVIDPSLSGATLYTIPDGLYPIEMCKIVDYLTNIFETIAISISNYVPEKDTENKTIDVILSLLARLNVIK